MTRVEQQLLEHSPAVQVRRPRVAEESTRPGLDRTELGAFLVRAELSDLVLVSGHRVVRIVGKGNQPGLLPLTPRTARAIDAAVGARTDGPLLARRDGRPLGRHAAGRIVRRLAKRAGIDEALSPHSLRHAAFRSRLLRQALGSCERRWR